LDRQIFPKAVIGPVYIAVFAERGTFNAPIFVAQKKLVGGAHPIAAGAIPWVV
jgi:hypothetical protein